jgi:hypothetical protein
MKVARTDADVAPVRDGGTIATWNVLFTIGAAPTLDATRSRGHGPVPEPYVSPNRRTEPKTTSNSIGNVRGTPPVVALVPIQ